MKIGKSGTIALGLLTGWFCWLKHMFKAVRKARS